MELQKTVFAGSEVYGRKDSRMMFRFWLVSGVPAQNVNSVSAASGERFVSVIQDRPRPQRIARDSSAILPFVHREPASLLARATLVFLRSKTGSCRYAIGFG